VKLAFDTLPMSVLYREAGSPGRSVLLIPGKSEAVKAAPGSGITGRSSEAISWNLKDLTNIFPVSSPITASDRE